MLKHTNVPSTWRMSTLGDELKWGSGGTPQTGSEKYYGGGIPWAKIGDLADGPLYETQQTITQAGMESSSAKWVEVGAILVAMYGSIGKLAIAERRLTTNQAIAFTRSKVEVPKYLFYYLMSIRPYLRSQGKGGTQSNISQTVIKQVPYPVAPAAVQESIVASIESHMSRLDNAIGSLKAVQAKLKQYRASVLKAAVEGRLVATEAELARKEGRNYEPASVLLERILQERKRRWIEDAAEKGRAKAEEKAKKAGKPWTAEDGAKALESEREKAAKKYKEPVAPDTEGLAELPEGWCWATVDQLSTFITSGSRGWAEYYADDGPVFLRIGNLDRGTIELDLSNVQRVRPPRNAEGVRTRVHAGDLVVSITADLGMIGVVPERFDEAYINQHIALVRLVPKASSDYIGWTMCSRLGQNELQRRNRGATKAGLGLDDIRAARIPLAPLEEQSRVVDHIAVHVSICDSTARTADEAHTRIWKLRQSVLKSAFSGKLTADGGGAQ